MLCASYISKKLGRKGVFICGSESFVPHLPGPCIGSVTSTQGGLQWSHVSRLTSIETVTSVVSPIIQESRILWSICRENGGYLSYLCFRQKTADHFLNGHTLFSFKIILLLPQLGWIRKEQRLKFRKWELS